MSVTLFENRNIRNAVIFILACLYVLSIVGCTVSFFTPNWLNNVGDDYSASIVCNHVGLVSGSCRYPYNTDSSGRTPDYVVDMRRTFYCVLTTMFILYTNLAMTVAGYIYNLFDNGTYMAFLSIHYALLYPIGAVSVLVSSIMLEVYYGWHIGFSTTLATISGGLMLLFYAGLRLYDYQYNSHWDNKKGR